MSAPTRIVVLPGDGIGPEVTAVARAVLDEVVRARNLDVAFEEQPFGHAAHLRTGSCFPEQTRRAVERADVVVLGAVGDPRADALPREERPEAALLELRAGIGVWANLRPTRVFDALVEQSPLRAERVRDTDVLVVRELGGGIYYGQPRGRRDELGAVAGYDTMVYSEGEVERIVRRACEAARARRGHVVSVDKANVLESSRLWREVATRVAAEYRDLRFEHRYVDAFAAEMVLRPNHYDVVVTGNLFGDILSDQLAVVGGSLGLLGSASFGEGTALYEPVHGSAPDIAGADVANPIGAILSIAMLLEHSLGDREASACVEEAVQAALVRGARTLDVAGARTPASTSGFGRAVLEQLRIGERVGPTRYSNG